MRHAGGGRWAEGRLVDQDAGMNDGEWDGSERGARLLVDAPVMIDFAQPLPGGTFGAE